MILHGSIVVCIGIDVNSLSSARRPRVGPRVTTRVWLGIHLTTSDKPNCNKKKNSSMGIYLNFGVFAFYIYIYIYLRTLHAHLHTTPADTVHTPHADEWLVTSRRVSIDFEMTKKTEFLSFF